MASRSPLLGPHARPNVLSAHSRGTVLEDVWPPLFWGPERLEEIKRKTVEVGWARECYETLLDEAGPILGDEPQLPIEPIGWRHSFYSPLSGEHLVFDPGESRRFVDPSNQQVWEGVEYRRAWALFVHERTYRLMRSMALLYRLNGDERYAKWAVAGLEKAITMFSHSELREGNSSEALYYQPLYDAQVLALIANTSGIWYLASCHSSSFRDRGQRDGSRHSRRAVRCRSRYSHKCHPSSLDALGGLRLLSDDPDLRPVCGYHRCHPTRDWLASLDSVGCCLPTPPRMELSRWRLPGGLLAWLGLKDWRFWGMRVQ
jgi:hypothetical protein